MDPAILRILDANLNQAFGVEALVSARDIQHDVGTRVTAPSEQNRGSTAQVATAAAKRAAESMRCIEEYGKIIDATAAARVEQLRYELYAIEQDILIGGPRRAGLRAARLHVLVTESACNGPWLTVCQQAIDGGADILQLREKSLCDRELLVRANRLRELTRDRGVLLIINDRPDIARLAGADGVHVGQCDLPVAQARRIVGPNALIGTSTHSLDEARRASEQGPDYIAAGPMFASPTKPDVPVQGRRLLVEVAAISAVPVVAVGGITPQNVSALCLAGLGGVAVCQSVVGAEDPGAAARALSRQLGRLER
jgi:thiamine-phosphate pyrophosphorylase